MFLGNFESCEPISFPFILTQFGLDLLSTDPRKALNNQTPISGTMLKKKKKTRATAVYKASFPHLLS